LPAGTDELDRLAAELRRVRGSIRDLGHGHRSFRPGRTLPTKRSGVHESGSIPTAAGFNANTNPYRYTGKRYDTGSGTYDMGARRYNAANGRFLQQDLYYHALADVGLSTDPDLANRYLFT
jgi:RHS repeat-associated protein